MDSRIEIIKYIFSSKDFISVLNANNIKAEDIVV